MSFLRLTRRHRGYVVFAITSLAVAGGATLMVFTLVNALWLKPLQFPDPDRVVILMAETANNPSEESWIYGGLETSGGWAAFEVANG